MTIKQTWSHAWGLMFGLILGLYVCTGMAGDIVISEIMYNPSALPTQPERLEHEFIELVNTADQIVDLSGWRFTSGIDYIIPEGTRVFPGQYLIVASDPQAFQTLYPHVIQVAGGWGGKLSNRGETITLENAQGKEIDSVSYADRGSWAQRILGPVDYHHRGWQWVASHDGEQRSLELIQLSLSNKCGANWAASLVLGGTPGQINSVASNNIPPLLDDIKVTPLIPGPNDPMIVSIELRDEDRDHAQTTLYYRIDGSSYINRDLYPSTEQKTYTVVPMSGSGKRRRAVIPPQRDGVVIEFFVEAVDPQGQKRTWPAPSWIDGEPQQVTNALLQVNGSFDPQSTRLPGAAPSYYLIMTQAEKDRLLDIGDNEGGENKSDAEMNATFISDRGGDMEIRFNTGVRVRGHGSRRKQPNNYRINFSQDDPWEGKTAINLNTQFPYLQLAGSVLFRLAGSPAAATTVVQLHVNGENLALTDDRMYGHYAQVEVIDSDFARRQYPQDNDGDLYKCMRIVRPGADLLYHGDDPNIYRINYFKRSHRALDDWSALINLCAAASSKAEDADYARQIEEIVDVDQWLRHMAVHTLLNNYETTLATGDGDDYYLYYRDGAGLFDLLAHDLDSIFGLGESPSQPETDIYMAITGLPGRSSGLSTMKRLLNHPSYHRRYINHIQDLMATVFSDPQLTATLRQFLGSWVPPKTLEQMLNFMQNRIAYIESTIPRNLSAATDLVFVDGLYETTDPSPVLFGSADVTNTESLVVGDHLATWFPSEGAWLLSTEAQHQGSVLIPSGSSWHYDDRYGPLPSDWHTTADFSLWPQGAAELGYGDNDEVTRVGYIDVDPCTPKDQKNTTTYFAHSFIVDNPSVYDHLTLRLLRDDGALICLNGIEIVRSNLPDGAIDYWTPAPKAISGSAERSFVTFTDIDPTLLQTGVNRLTVEIHQDAKYLTDISFDLELTALPQAEGLLTLTPGVNRIPIQAFDSPAGQGDVTAMGTVDIEYDDGDSITIGGLLETDLTLSALDGPWEVTETITVAAGAKLTIEAGTTLFFAEDAGIRVEEGGCLQALGSATQRIHLTRMEGALSWQGLRFKNTLEENRLMYVDMVYGDGQGENIDLNDARLELDHMTFSSTNDCIFDAHHPHVIIRDCVFPSIEGTEPIHVAGLVDNEQLIFERCVFGTATGYNDTMDLSGGQAGGPAVQFFDCTFLGGSDDGIDCDGIDAYIEGCHFQGFTSDSSSDTTSNAIATGRQAGHSSRITLVRSTFIDCDHAILIKEECEIVAQHNTFVGMKTAVVAFGEPYRNPPRSPGRSAVLEGNIFWQNNRLFQHYYEPDMPEYGPELLIINDCVIPQAWHALGEGNLDTDPVFLDYPYNLNLELNSAARLATRDGLDIGALGTTETILPPTSPTEALLLNEVLILTDPNQATQPFVELIHNGPSPFPLDGYFLETSTGSMQLLPPGDYVDPGVPRSTELTLTPNAQGDTLGIFAPDGSLVDAVTFGPQCAQAALGRWGATGRWRLCIPTPGQSNQLHGLGDRRQVRINEILADPDVLASEDFVELYNPHTLPVDLSGCLLSDRPLTEPMRSTLPPLSFIPGRSTLLLIADGTTDPGHVDLRLSSNGEMLGLFTPEGDVIDRILFGPQTPDVSLGRSPDGSLGLVLQETPTPGASNPYEAPPPPPEPNLAILAEILSMDAIWAYDQNDVPLDPNWIQPDYADSDWPSGPALLYVEGSALPGPKNTPLELGAITYYFRTHFQMEQDPTIIESLNVTTILDDGAIIYLNGQELFRLGVGDGVLQHDTRAERSVGNAAIERHIALPATALRPGDNVLAVEVHQTSSGSSDIVFGLQMEALVPGQ